MKPSLNPDFDQDFPSRMSAMAPDATLVIITPLHRATENTPNINGKVLQDYMDMLRHAAEYYSLPVLDLYATYGIQPAVPALMEKYMPDGLHPNDEGHLLLARKIAQFLRQL